MSHAVSTVHAFVDLSPGSGANAELDSARLQQPDALGSLVERAALVSTAHVALPDGWHAHPDASAALDQAFFGAAAAGSHLLVVLGAARPSSDAVSVLIEILDADPLLGFVHPRFADPDSGEIACPRAIPGTEPGMIARPVLATLPSSYVTTEFLSPCFLIRRELIGNMGPVLEGWTDTRGVLGEYAARARRLGFRTAIANRAVVSLRGLGGQAAEVRPSLADEARIASLFPDVGRARTEFSRRDVLTIERLVSRLFDAPRRWLLDGRNVVPIMNGTAKAALGICDGLYAQPQRPDITLWVTEAAADYHGLDRRYRRWRVVRTAPDDRFAAAFRLSQPWSLQEARDLDAFAPLNVYLMNDTIAWDTVYPAPPHLDATWRYVASYADGIVFVSEFSRQRFLSRFALSPAVRTAVVHHSLSPRDYATWSGPASASAPYWLVLGNSYDHKHVRPTLDLLARAFPTRHLVAVGARGPNRPRLTCLDSGSIEESRMQALYAGAEIMVFPSFYEGFGLPLVNALAYDRPVVARDSPLLREIGGAYRGPGRLVTYRTETDLVHALSRLSRGLDVEEIPLARADDERVPLFDWVRAGYEIDGFITSLLREVSPVQANARATLASIMGA